MGVESLALIDQAEVNSLDHSKQESVMRVSKVEQSDDVSDKILAVDRQENTLGESFANRLENAADFNGDTSEKTRNSCELSSSSYRQRLTSLSQLFPKPSSLVETLSEWLSDRTRLGFYRSVQMKYAQPISYDEDDIYIDFEEGIHRIFDPYYDIDFKEDVASIDGRVDKQGLPVGRAVVTTRSGDDLLGTWKNGVRCGNGKTLGENFEKYGLIGVQGPYTDGILHGIGQAQLRCGLSLEGLFNNGYLEGPVVGQRDNSRDVSRERSLPKDSEHLTVEICRYRKGLRTGSIWQRVEGGGWLHGKVDDQGDLTGDDIMYIYPDLFTCLVGKFKTGLMENARLSYLESIDWDNEIMIVKASRSVIDNHVYRHSPSHPDTGFTVDQLQEDPYESLRCVVGQSFIDGAGDGLFSKVDIEAGQVVSFYHGVWYPLGQTSPNKSCDYQIFLDWKNAPQSDFLDIPPESRDHENYRASLGHKVNHSFTPNCEFIKFYHPTFGNQVLGVRAIRDIYCGEEYTVNYKYSLKDAPLWYQNQFISPLLSRHTCV